MRWDPAAATMLPRCGRTVAMRGGEGWEWLARRRPGMDGPLCLRPRGV